MFNSQAACTYILILYNEFRQMIYILKTMRKDENCHAMCSPSEKYSHFSGLAVIKESHAL